MEINQNNFNGANKISFGSEDEIKSERKNKTKWWKNPKITVPALTAILVAIIGASGSLLIINQSKNMNNFNQNNQYGDNIMNFGSQPRKLNSQTQNQLKESIKSGSVVDITSVLGDGEAYGLANEIKSYLEGQGYKVIGVSQSVFNSPVIGQIILPPKGNDNTYKIIIGNKQQ